MMAVRIARGLDRTRFACGVVFPCPGPLASEARDLGLAVETFDLLPLSRRQAAEKGRRTEWLQSRWAYARDFRSLLRETPPDLVYVHSAIQPLPGFLARREGLPVVWHVQETLDFASLGNRFRRRMIKRLARAVIFCGWAARDSFGAQPEGQTWIVAPNALTRMVPDDTAGLRGANRRNLEIPDNTLVLAMVGGVHPRKGLDVLLRALQALPPREGREVLLLVAGGEESAPPPFLQKIESLRSQASIQSRVRMLGHHDDVIGLLAASDVFVLASRSEGLPLAVVEAFAMGLPAVLTDVGDCAVLTGDGERGYTVPPDDPAAFAAALDRLLADPQTRNAMGDRARDYARKHFPFSRYLEQVSQVLEEAAGRRTGIGQSADRPPVG